MPKPKENSYGTEVLTSPYGRYFWCVPLMDVDFIPYGVKRARDRYHLTPKDHTSREAAVKWAARMAERHAAAVARGEDPKAWPALNG